MLLVTSSCCVHTTPLSWHREASFSRHLRLRIYRHLKDNMSGDSEDRLIMCNSVKTCFVLLKRDIEHSFESLTNPGPEVRCSGRVQKGTECLFLPLSSPHFPPSSTKLIFNHPPLSKVTIVKTTTIIIHENVNVISHNYYWEKKKNLIWYISVTWSEIPLFYWLSLIFQ
jgi:hypothetical protein